MIVAERERSKTAKEIEDLASISSEVVHAFSTVDDYVVETQQTHQAKLAWIEVLRKKIDNALTRKVLGIFHAQKVRLVNFGVSAGIGFAGHHGLTLVESIVNDSDINALAVVTFIGKDPVPVSSRPLKLP